MRWWPQAGFRATWASAAGRMRPSALAHLSFGTAAVLLAVLAWTVFDATRQARDAALLVDRTHDFLAALADARENFAHIEAAQRGYLLNGREQYIDEREEAVNRLHSALSHLAAMTADRPAQAQRVRILGTLARQRIEVARDNADLRDEIGFDRAWPVAATRIARQASMPFYELAEKMHAEEQAVLDRQARLELESGRYVRQVLVLSFVAGLLILLPAYGATLYQTRRRTAAEERVADLVESLPLVVWRMKTAPDGTRRFTYVSPQIARQRGLDAAAVLKGPNAVWHTILEEDRAGVLKAMRDSEANLSNFDCRYRVVGASGEQSWIHSSATLRRQADGIILWNGFWQDVTRQKLLQERLEDANKELEAFSYSVSHDLRSPLVSISGFTAHLNMRAREKLDEREQRFVDRIGAGVRQMSDLIDGMLSLATVNRTVMRREEVRLDQVALVVIHELREAEPARQVEAVVEPGLVARGDPRLLRQLLANVIGNAWKFTARQAQARIEVGRSGDAFFVRDNGVGFRMEQAAKLFGAFQRLHSADQFPGTGIGLATVRRIVVRHGGRVWAHSEPGQGTTIFFTLGSPVTGEEEADGPHD
jgi:signal transduction histidine kinase